MTCIRIPHGVVCDTPSGRITGRSRAEWLRIDTLARKLHAAYRQAEGIGLSWRALGREQRDRYRRSALVLIERFGVTWEERRK